MKKSFLTRYFPRSSLRLKMMLMVAGVLAVLTTILILDITRRQRAVMIQLQKNQTRNMALSMAAASAVWLAEHDVSGLQEIVEAQKRYPEVRYAMLLNEDGRVLAHTDQSRRGQFVRDLPMARPTLTLSRREGDVVDVIAPVYLAGRLVGWVRLGFGQLENRAQLAENTQKGWLYAAIAIAVGALVAGIVAARFTRRLYQIRAVSAQVQQGGADRRVPDLGRDEAGQLGRDFNAMLDALAQRSAELKAANRNLEESRTEALRQMEAAQLAKKTVEQYNTQLQTEAASRQRAEEAIRLQSAALEAAANAIVITDRNAVVIWANRSFTTLTGYSLGEVIGHKTNELISSGKQDRKFFTHLWQTILADRVWQGELVNRRKDGSLYTEEMTITPLKSEGRDITHFIAIKQDITQRKQDEENRQALEMRYRQAQKMEAVGRLAGGVAHDFNNLLTAIIGNAQLLRLGGLGAREQTEAIAQIDAAGRRAAGLTRQMLAFSRQQPVVFARINLNEVVANMGKILPRMLGEDIRMQFQYAAMPLPVDADTTMLDQVLLNICVNARDAMPEGGTVTIATSAVEYDAEAVRTFPEGQAGRFACLSISDQGPGIDPAILPRIFEPFFTTKEVGKGTGLGLATVHGIVEQHKGWIHLESVIGRGTTFHVHLPLQEATEAVADAHSLPPDSLGRGGTILVVEDEDSVRGIVTEVLSRNGYRIIEASNGREGLERWRERRAEVNMLLTDIVMPGGLDGQALAAEILKEAPGLKVGYMSGYMRPNHTRSPYFRVGANYLPKPFEISQLVRFVRQVLDN
ncbi:MAG: ATP-binding protein [Opitutales bacterium]